MQLDLLTLDTSEAAHESIKPKAATLRTLVLVFLRGRHRYGATDLEMQDMLGMEGSTQRPRRLELMRSTPAQVVDSGRRRKTASGRLAVVWIAREYANA